MLWEAQSKYSNLVLELKRSEIINTHGLSYRKVTSWESKSKYWNLLLELSRPRIMNMHRLILRKLVLWEQGRNSRIWLWFITFWWDAYELLKQLHYILMKSLRDACEILEVIHSILDDILQELYYILMKSLRYACELLKESYQILMNSLREYNICWWSP